MWMSHTWDTLQVGAKSKQLKAGITGRTGQFEIFSVFEDSEKEGVSSAQCYQTWKENRFDDDYLPS
jgi:hypothetical protein